MLKIMLVSTAVSIVVFIIGAIVVYKLLDWAMSHTDEPEESFHR